MRRWLAGLLVVALLTTPGCLDPYRVRVPAVALDASPLEWEVTLFDQTGGTLGAKVKESRFVHQPEDERSPPFPGVLQVFALRGGQGQDRDALLEQARRVVDSALENETITVDPSKDATGSRKLRSGVTTEWFLHEGTIQSGGGSFFNPESKITVRVLAEVGVDGRSKTGFIAVAFVKVAQQEGNIVPGVPPTTTTDPQTWFDVVGDPEGSIKGATFSNKDRGLMFNLVTHG